MPQDAFTPTIYVKDNCPFCLKVRLFLLESGYSGQVQQRFFKPGDAEEQAIRAEIGPHLEKVSFPAAQIEAGRFITDSDAIVAHFAEKSGVAPASLPVFTQYAGGVFPNIMKLYQENMELKKKLA